MNKYIIGILCILIITSSQKGTIEDNIKNLQMNKTEKIVSTQSDYKSFDLPQIPFPKIPHNEMEIFKEQRTQQLSNLENFNEQLKLKFRKLEKIRFDDVGESYKLRVFYEYFKRASIKDLIRNQKQIDSLILNNSLKVKEYRRFFSHEEHNFYFNTYNEKSKQNILVKCKIKFVEQKDYHIQFSVLQNFLKFTSRKEYLYKDQSFILLLNTFQFWVVKNLTQYNLHHFLQDQYNFKFDLKTNTQYVQFFIIVTSQQLIDNIEKEQLSTMHTIDRQYIGPYFQMFELLILGMSLSIMYIGKDLYFLITNSIIAAQLLQGFYFIFKELDKYKFKYDSNYVALNELYKSCELFTDEQDQLVKSKNTIDTIIYYFQIFKICFITFMIMLDTYILHRYIWRASVINKISQDEMWNQLNQTGSLDSNGKMENATEFNDDPDKLQLQSWGIDNPEHRDDLIQDDEDHKKINIMRFVNKYLASENKVGYLKEKQNKIAEQKEII